MSQAEDEDLDEIICDLVLAVQQRDLVAIQSTFQRPFKGRIPPNQIIANRTGNSASGGSLYYLPVNLVDRDGISLLQWAAINNRKQIALYLLQQAGSMSSNLTYKPGATISINKSRNVENKFINNSAFINMCGGVLKETALQWALRR